MEKMQITYNKLYSIYQKYRKKYKGNPDSKQMFCMWSTSNPPDKIEDTKQIFEIEDTFDISIDDDTCYMLYDMDLDEATFKIEEMINQQC